MRSLKSQYLVCWCVFCGYPWVCVLSYGLGWTNEHELSRFGSQVDTSATCEDLEGVGSFDTTCFLNSNLYRNTDIYVVGSGNLEILPHVEIACPVKGCTITFNLSGNVKVGHNASVMAGTVVFYALTLTLGPDASLNTSSLAGSPPPQTSGTPVGFEGSGGGHGGRGASCLKTNQTSNWGGDVYWTTLSNPWAYGSSGGGSSVNHKLGGGGGGRVLLNVSDILYINGTVSAEGGDGGTRQGGGSGGSIIVQAQKL